MFTSLSMKATLLTASTLLLLGLGIWALAATGGRPDQRTLERMRRGAGANKYSGRLEWLGRLGRSGGVATGHDPSLPRLLVQAGFRSSRALEMFQGLRLLLVLSLVSLYLPLHGYFGHANYWLYGGSFAMLALGYLIPKWILVYLASRRRLRLDEEVQIFAALSRLLLHSGLGVHQLLTVVDAESGRLLPEIAKELTRILRQVAIGAELDDILAQTGQELEVPDLQDLLKLLSQVHRYGGAVDVPFSRFIQILEQNRRIRLQEKVNVMSGKMTVVMVLFEFPALLAFLGAPGFIAIIDALGRIGGD